MSEQEPTRQPEPAENSEEGSIKPLFALGQIVGTPGALDVLEAAGMHPATLITRHVTGDWGDLGEQDKQANEEALQEGFRLFSSYQLENGNKIWLITEHDRSVTTLLLPSEY